MKRPTIRVLWHWLSMGPYHFARMNALAQIPGVELTVVESTCVDDHGWIREASSNSFEMITLSRDALSTELLRHTGLKLANILSGRRPDIVVSAGRYSEPHSFSAVRSHKKHFPTCIVVLWSESTRIDHKRYRFKELMKRLFLLGFDGALVAGGPHASYLQLLGMPAGRIKIVGNCVDNDFFSTVTHEAQCRAEADVCPTTLKSFFLYVGRMVPAKNLPRMLEAYQLYRQRAGTAAWDLVLVGMGPEENSLRKQAGALGVGGIWFDGLRQVNELRRYYARAKCLVLPSISEPWGLVVNEAMASGLPVLVSDRCGCASDLVRNGVNGFIFDPLNPGSLAELFFKISSGDVHIETLGLNGRDAINKFTPRLFAERVATHLQSLYLLEDQHACERYRSILKHLALSGADLMNSVWARLN